MDSLRSWVRVLLFVWGCAFAVFAAVPAHSTNLKFSGTVAYTISGATVDLTAVAVQNLDTGGNSGTIRLELWAFPSPFTGSQAGYKLAQYQLNPLLGGYQYNSVDSGYVAYARPPDGTWFYTLFLTEYTAGPVDEGYTYRDYGNFPGPVTYGAPAAPTVVTLVEYHHASFDHYFVTPVAAEIALLDAHAPPFQEWSRTGFSFDAYANANAPANSVGICRFFNSHFAPKSSHFYAPHGFGCEATLSLFPDWGLEDGQLFNTLLPDSAGGCPSGTIPVYRLYNNGMGGAPNHRFVTSLSERQNMLGKGYTPEGNGIGVGMCVPASGSVATSAQGIWQGTTNTNQTVAGVVLADGTSYFIYSQAGVSTSIVGAVLGNATFNHGTLSAPNAVDFVIGGAAYNATVSGTYVQGSTINATIAAAGTTGTVTLYYDSVYDQPASLAATAGTYTATVGSLAGVQTATLTVAANGAITGGGGGCTFSGAATPHGSVNVFDVQVTFNGGACLFGTSTIYGVAFYDAPNRTLYGAAPNTAHTDVLLFIGTK